MNLVPAISAFQKRPGTALALAKTGHVSLDVATHLSFEEMVENAVVLAESGQIKNSLIQLEHARTLSDDDATNERLFDAYLTVLPLIAAASGDIASQMLNDMISIFIMGIPYVENIAGSVNGRDICISSANSKGDYKFAVPAPDAGIQASDKKGFWNFGARAPKPGTVLFTTVGFRGTGAELLKNTARYSNNQATWESFVNKAYQTLAPDRTTPLPSLIDAVKAKMQGNDRNERRVAAPVRRLHLIKQVEQGPAPQALLSEPQP